MKATGNKAPAVNGQYRPLADAPAAPNVGDSPASANIDQLRDIIFGGQMRDYDKRFARMEERLVKEVSELREEVSKRYTSLERYVRGEVESLTRELREVRAQQLEQDHTITEETQRRQAELRALIDQEVAQLREDKTDRSGLSALFLELALRLRGESVVPRQE